ncbi:MAG TPA: DJ-1/PfpI family protein [Rudaea sp.]|nr:DJ-1/PfpI family protein [Rudaea sp.]
MKRRDLLRNSAALGLAGALPFSRSVIAQSDSGSTRPSSAAVRAKPAAAINKLTPPADGSIPVAFLISDGAVVIDFCGPWEVFDNVMAGGRMAAFRLFTVAETAEPIKTSGGMKIVPNYTIGNAPAPKIIVIPAQSDASQAVLEWVRKSSRTADVTMSVCTGAYLLAATGLMAGRSMTTHHASYFDLARQFPDIHVQRGARFVEDGSFASAGGLSSGIDLALRVVERYYGRDTAAQTAYAMEYQGRGWMDPNSNSVYARLRTSANGHPLCVVCSMAVDAATAPKSVYKGATYYFCSLDHKGQFDAAPEQFVALIRNTSSRN